MNNTSSPSSSIQPDSIISTSASLPLRPTLNTPASNTGRIEIEQQEQQHDFTNHNQLSLDDTTTHHHHYQHILDNDTSGMSPMIKIRRDSADESNTAFTSSEAGWNSFNFNASMTTMDSSTATPAFVQHRNQPCLELSTTQAMAYPHQATWPMSASSDTFSPNAGIDHIPDFNNPFAGNQLHYQMVAPGPLQNSAFPTSPPFSTSSSDGHELRNNSIQERPQSPSFVASTTLLRRDGIRKKNARFDIPVERNLRTIDQLINQTNDEGQLKELKQQKRLLRNRQAALDSRQRKKQHTERLEEEKKHYNVIISNLEEALEECKTRDNEWIQKEEAWAHSQQQYNSYVESLQMEKEELVRRHTIESGELRRKNAILMEQLQRLDSTAMSHQPSTTSMSGEYSEFDEMNLGSWDMADEFTIENHAPVEQLSKAVTAPEAEKPATSALLLMLLLCGAWVASRNDSSGSNVLPAISDDMRVASANVLDSLYKDSGVQLDGVNTMSKTFPGSTSRTVLSAFESAGVFTSNLDNLHHSLSTPTPRQVKDQAFSMTPSQYYELTSGDARYQQAFYDHQRKAMGGPVQQEVSTIAETYTRSLLRDKVSTQVLKNFARMVAHSNIQSSTPWKTESI